MANAYQQLIKAKAANCRGTGSKATVRKKASAYVRSAVKSGKSKREATASANRVLNRSCSAPLIGKRKKHRRVKGPKMRHVLVMGRRKRHSRR